MYGIDVESADCRMFCSVQTTSRPTVWEGVFVYAVIQSVAYSGYMLSLAVWFCNVLFEKQFENLIHCIHHPSRGIHQQCDFAKCHLCTHSFSKSEEDFEFFFLQYFVGKNLTFFQMEARPGFSLQFLLQFWRLHLIFYSSHLSLLVFFLFIGASCLYTFLGYRVGLISGEFHRLRLYFKFCTSR